MKKYSTALFIFSIIIIIAGLAGGKISGDSFREISLIGSLFAILKIILVGVIFFLGVAAIIPSILIDLVLLFFSPYGFDLTARVWNYLWGDIVLKWFWYDTTGSSLLFASLIIALITGLTLRRKR